MKTSDENMENPYYQEFWILKHFTSQQKDPPDDKNLFSDHLSKCRFCFRAWADVGEQVPIEIWHRKTFHAMTGNELICSQDSSKNLCSGCVEILKFFIELRETAEEMQNIQDRYYEYMMRDLIEVKIEPESLTESDNDKSDNNNEEPPYQVDSDSDAKTEALEDDPNDEFNELMRMIEELNPDHNDDDKNPSEDTTPIKHVKKSHKKKRDKNAPNSHVMRRVAANVPRKVRSSLEPLNCDLCSFKTEIKGILANHMISRHKLIDANEEGNIKCQIDGCNKAFKEIINLEQHQRHVHVQDLPVRHCRIL